MRSTERWRPSATAIEAEDRFAELSRAFYARLRNDRVHLATLSASLARIEGDASCVFEEIRVFAHRLRGAATIFEAAELGVAAQSLEEATSAAASTHADNSDPGVWAALVNLSNRLAAVNGPVRV
jgi:HPt (histidine-containing phosphotransfer) domain-containing protein